MAGGIYEGKEDTSQCPQEPLPIPSPCPVPPAFGTPKTQSSCLTYYPLTSTRLTSSYVSSKGLEHLASGLSHCHHLEELE